MDNLMSPAAHTSADKRHAAAIVNHGEEVARLWDHTPEAAKARDEHLKDLQGWKSAEMVLYES